MCKDDQVSLHMSRAVKLVRRALWPSTVEDLAIELILKSSSLFFLFFFFGMISIETLVVQQKKNVLNLFAPHSSDFKRV